MPYDIPTLPALTQRTEADFERNAPDALRRADAKVAARALSGTAYELYGYQAYIARQSNPATCDEEMLLRWADWRLDGGRNPAVAAKGLATVTGSSGALVDAGQAYRSDDGRRYLVTQGVKLVNGAATLQLMAEEVGSLGNIEAGNLTAVTPVLGVNPTASIDADGLIGGAELEELEALRGRVQAAFKNPSKVGNSADFIEWALEVPGVTRAWALPRWMGPGTFGLAFVRDGDPEIIPTPAQVAEVQTHLDLRRPVTAEIYAIAPVARAINFSIHLVPDGIVLRDAVTQALSGMLVDEGGPGQTLKISRLRAAISNTPGEADHVLSVPEADVVMGANEVAVLGVMTWL